MAIGLANTEVVDRYGSAGAEHLKGLRGIDRETGTVFDRSLHGVSEGKINHEFSENNINQQAGFSAEIGKTSKDNAEYIIQGSNRRVSRTEDVADFGKNHMVADHVEMMDGVVDMASISQMKFLNDPENFVRKVACGEGGGKNDLSRYMECKAIDLPTEQVQSTKDFCRKEAQSLRQQADAVEAVGKTDLAKELRQDADNYEEIEGKIRDSGLTREQARELRLDPDYAVTKEILGIGHRSGLEGAKIGAVIGGAISVVMNGMAVYKGDKTLEAALKDVMQETVIAGGAGYGTAFVGSTLKSLMQQAEAEMLRSLSKTALPALVVGTCLTLGSSIAAYANGSLGELALMQQMGGTLTNSMAGSMGAAFGQMAIPVPVLGALIGGMVGGTLAGMFYQAFVESGKRVDISHERSLIIQAECEAAIKLAQAYRQQVEAIVNQKLAVLGEGQKQLLQVLSTLNDVGNADAFAKGINDFAALLGKQLEFCCKAEFDDFMADESTTLKL